ncbi:HDOD domain-containing protein [Undibacterium sp. RuRC25W]|uniref:HDOD domain-containing protein n=1 Tax=Undibacterium sp. RuRC25W TaxID=3413047 RepID=UPI003BF347ED
MAQIAIQEIIDDVKDLPTLPAVVMEILNNIDKENLDTMELAKKVTHDIALTAKTLRYANSAYYSTVIKVTTIQQAIAILGLNTVQQIIVTASLTGCFPENNCRGFSHKEFWKHSNIVAIVAKSIASQLNFNQDVAFTAGLLHDIGILVLVTYHGADYEQVLAWQANHQCSRFEAEKHVIGITHAIVGEALANQWNFSEQMTHAIAGHHHPETPGLRFLASIVNLADHIGHILNTHEKLDDVMPDITALPWEKLGLTHSSLNQILTHASKEFQHLQESVDL